MKITFDEKRILEGFLHKAQDVEDVLANHNFTATNDDNDSKYFIERAIMNMFACCISENGDTAFSLQDSNNIYIIGTHLMEREYRNIILNTLWDISSAIEITEKVLDRVFRDNGYKVTKINF